MINGVYDDDGQKEISPKTPPGEIHNYVGKFVTNTHTHKHLYVYSAIIGYSDPLFFTVRISYREQFVFRHLFSSPNGGLVATGYFFNRNVRIIFADRHRPIRSCDGTFLKPISIRHYVFSSSVRIAYGQHFALRLL